MAERIEFSGNYSDLSTDTGFQFEFSCNRCGRGVRTPFKPSTTGRVASLLETASSLFGGLFNSAAEVGQRVKSAGWEQAHDEAFAEAISALKSDFIQCPRCQAWVCRQGCWNHKRGLCKECAPDLGVEMSAAQASRSVEEVWAHAQMAEEDKKLAAGNWRETIKASCPKCEAPLAGGAKFCPECGEKLSAARHCEQCGAKLNPNAKFCAECGAKAQG